MKQLLGVEIVEKKKEMRSIRQRKKGICFMFCFLMVLGWMPFATIVNATETVDITPPWAKLTIVGAVESDGIYYVESADLEVEIYAHDDTCADTEIDYYISETPIDTTQPLEESLWQKYTPGLKMSYTLSDLTSTNILYAAFRDTAGNVSLIYEGTDVEYTIEYHANGGEGEILEGTGYHGMAYVVTNQTPTREGYYFLGWSTSSTATTASYEQGDIISAAAFRGSNKVIDLYAVWSDNKANLALLADKVKIGDYVDYPVYYENVLAYGSISTKRGWRVISKDIDLDGNPSPGTVNLVSAGCPLSYYHVGDTTNSITALTTNFLITEFDDTVVKQKFVKSGFLGYDNLKDVFVNSYTQLDSGNMPKVRSMVKEDILRITGYDEMQTAYEMDLRNPKYEELFVNNEYYWLASAYSTSTLWYVYTSGGVGSSSSLEFGVRPVVSLKSNVKTYVKDTSGRWQIEIEG